MTNTDQETIENSQELSEEELEQQRLQLEEHHAEIRRSLHKIVDGIPIALTEEEWEEFNRPDPSQEAIDLEIQKNLLINQRRKYLGDTDWYLIREADQPQSYPEEVKNKRNQAREEINLIESSSTMQQLEAFSSNF
ncbi:MAG: hypothetical protein KGP29_02745 [Proteobacteria bacterium]|nr:hypothetical protein [Pseudomonadota bacterium]